MSPTTGEGQNAGPQQASTTPAPLRTRTWAIASVGYAVFYAVFFFQGFSSGRLIAPSDSLDFGVAAYLSPPMVWTDGMYSGHPAAADAQTLSWYPVLRVFRLLGLDWNVFLIAAYVITATTTFMLVHRLTQSTWAAVFGGLVGSFNAMMLGYIANFNQIHAYAWVPLLFLGLQIVREGGLRQGAGLAAIASALTWLAGHPQISVYATYVSVVLVALGLAVDRPGAKTAVTRVVWSLGGLTLGFVLAAVAVVPMLEFGAASGRFESNWQLFIGSSYPVRELLTLVVPFAFGGFRAPEGAVPYVGETADSAYVGILLLALGLAAPVVTSPHRANARIWMAVVVVETLLALGPATPLASLYFHLPGTARFQAPLRHLFLTSLGLTVCGSLAFAHLVTTGRRAAITTAVAATAILGSVALGVVLWSGSDVRAAWAVNDAHVAWALGWPAAVVVAFGVVMLVATFVRRRAFASQVLGVLLLTVEGADLAGFHYRWPGYRFAYADVEHTSLVPRPRIEALRRELLRTGERLLPADGSKNPFVRLNLTRAWNLPTATGSGSLNIARYAETIGADSSGGIVDDTFADENLAFDLFAVRYVLLPRESPLLARLAGPDGRWQTVEALSYDEDSAEDHYVLLRNRRARPRAWCVPQVIEVGADEARQAIRTGRLRNDRPFDPSLTALLEQGALTWQARDATTSRPVVARVQPRKYRVESDVPCVLVASEVHYPWWRAAVDGAAVPVLRVNHTMVGIAVPPGRHVVTLWLQPVSVWVGAALTGLGLMGCLWLWWPRRSDPGIGGEASRPELSLGGL